MHACVHERLEVERLKLRSRRIRCHVTRCVVFAAICRKTKLPTGHRPSCTRPNLHTTWEMTSDSYFGS